MLPASEGALVQRFKSPDFVENSEKALKIQYLPHIELFLPLKLLDKNFLESSAERLSKCVATIN